MVEHPEKDFRNFFHVLVDGSQAALGGTFGGMGFTARPERPSRSSCPDEIHCGRLEGGA